MTDLTAAIAALSTLQEGTEQGAGQVHLEHPDSDLAVLRLDHPQRRNALSVAMMVQLAQHVQALSHWPGKVVVLTASPGDVFCSGGDLSQIADATPEQAKAMSVAMSAVLDTLLDLPLLSVAAIDGLAVGGGAELVTACDYRVGGPAGGIYFVHGRLGIAPGWGGAARLVRLVGRRTALRILTGARPLRMGEAERLGLVDHRADGPILEAALAWIAPARRLPVAALSAIKRQVVSAGQGAEVQAAIFGEVWGAPDHRAALERLQRHRR